MFKIKLAFLGLIAPIMFSAQSFTGSIEFKSITTKDTSINVFSVKDKNVRLDQFGKKSGNVEGSFIFDLANNTMKFVNPKRKVWGEHKSDTPPIINGTCESTKTKNTKTVLGVKCTEYTVKNTTENTVISYWIASGNYEFFVPMVKLYNRKDKQNVYFNQLKDLPSGAMPLLSEEKQISDGKLVSRMEATKISKGGVDDAKLSVPADYKKYEQ